MERDRGRAGLSRRALLTGTAGVAVVAAGAALVDARVLPGKGHIERALHIAPGQGVDASIPAVEAGPIVSGRFASARFRRRVGWAVAYPPGSRDGAALPVAVALPGRGVSGVGFLHDIGYPSFLAAGVDGGGRPYAIAGVDGGTSYWHPRAGGDDPLGMLVDELLPLLDRMSLRTSTFGVLGVSMGGYGSLLLARQSSRDALRGRHLAVAAAASPALWESSGATAPGAFDDADDWREWGDLVAHPGVAPDTALWVSCGDGDPFAASTRAY
ncbi:MAG: alpha/beta hydrolase-fold protein, partial [Mycobacteriales bacterium]